MTEEQAVRLILGAEKNREKQERFVMRSSVRRLLVPSRQSC